MYSFQSSRALEARINAAQTSAAARNAFDEGFQSIPVWNILSAFDITTMERDSYTIEKREPEILTTIPELQSCGQDIPVVSGNPEGRPVWFTPSKYRMALKMCKDKCGPEDFNEKLLQAEREAGAGFGKVMEQLFWAGDGFQGGITRLPGLELFGAQGTPYANLNTKNAVEIANFFSMQIHGMDDPRMYLGPIQQELLGWRQQGTGDNCSEIWQCLMQTLSRRFNETPEATAARFVTIDAFDFITGIDPNNAGDQLPTIMFIDRENARMGASANEEVGTAMAIGHDFVEAPRSMAFTTPQARKEGAVRFAFGHIDLADAQAQVGTRFGNRGVPAVSVPTPIV